MRKKFNIKAKLSVAMAAVMVITMAAPGPLTYAEAPADPPSTTSITFDPQNGPGLDLSTYKKITKKENFKPTGTGSAKKFEASGTPGQILVDSGDFAGLDDSDMLDFGNGKRPKMPNFLADDPSGGSDMSWPGFPEVKWEGYTFKGWEQEDGNLVTRLPYILPYDKPVTYKALWVGNNTSLFTWRVEHYRDFRTGGDDWPSADDYNNPAKIRRFYDTTWKREANANSPVSDSFLRSIPGYQVKDVLIKNNRIRGYGEASGHGTGAESATITPTKALKGNMPNDDLTVAYRYEPNDQRKFAVTVKCVMQTEPLSGLDSSGATSRTIQIIPPTVVANLPVETVFEMGPEKAVKPPVIPHYEVDTSVPPTVESAPSDLSGTGVISAADAGMKAVGNDVTGPMPNENVTITYSYKLDSSLRSNLTITSMDDSNVAFADSPLTKDGLEVGKPMVVTFDPRPGYQHDPNVSKSGDITSVKKEVGSGGKLTLTVTPGIQEGIENPGQITLTYLKDLSDSGFWGQIVFYNGPHGSFGNDEMGKPIVPQPIFFKKDLGMTIAEATKGIRLVPESKFYQFDGWYLADDSGEKMGSKLDDDYRITDSTKLVPSFSMADEFWAKLTFAAGSNGSISEGGTGTVTRLVKKESTWGDVTKPSLHADSGYHFVSWLDEGGNEIVDGTSDAMIIQGDHTYTAKFAPTYNVDDGLLTMPDIRGAVNAADGRGKIEVSGANIDRKYALTDRDGTVLKVKLGTNASSFDGLDPGAVYRVYEIGKSAHLADPSENPDALPQVLPGAVDPGQASQPASVSIPAIGGNYTVSEDAGGMMKVTVQPAAPHTQYAILDVDGHVMNSSENDGWVTPQAGSNSAVLGGLAPDQLYVVVAKQTGEEGTAADRLRLGTQISVMKEPTRDQEYTFSLVNGGYISEIDYADGREPLKAADGQVTSARVRENDKVTINAYRTAGDIPDGNKWGSWSVLIGQLKLPGEGQRYMEITVKKPGNVVLQANYPEASSASGTLTFDYSPKNGATALDLSDTQVENLKTHLLSKSDKDAMALNGDVKYTVNFKRGIPKATESNAAKEALAQSLGSDIDPENVKVPWVLNSSLSRQVAGSNKELASGSNATPIQIYSEIDRSIQGYAAYGLWEVLPDGELRQVTLSPDAESSDSTGIVHFDGKVGTRYIMTYLRSYQVTVKDEGHAHLYTAYVMPGAALSETELYNSLKELSYTDAATGENYIFGGVELAAGTAGYDPDSPINRNLSLKVIYTKEDDTEWRAARDALAAQINLATALRDQQSTSSDDKDRLNAVIDPAREALTEVPRLSVSELETLRANLTAVMDSISGGGKPDKPVIPPVPVPPHHTGGGGGGGGGGSFSTKVSGPSREFGGYKTYFAGVEGQWKSVGADWSFVSMDQTPVKDQWINVTYGDGRNTLTYHMDKNGIMNHGWYQDTDGSWYYLDDTPGSGYGRLNVGWQYDAGLQKWFYLNTFKGLMTTGWQQVGDDWYYLSPASLREHPLGSLYTNGLTPDGYPVDENGRWIRETP